jgi:hypothetical protein
MRQSPTLAIVGSFCVFMALVAATGIVPPERVAIGFAIGVGLVVLGDLLARL